MSLLDDASLIITPNATKAGKLYSVIPNTDFGDINVVRATTATRLNASSLIENVALNVPRLDYTNASCPSILVEPQRTNLTLRSEQFDGASWLKTNTVITPNISNAPNQTQTASKLITNSGISLSAAVFSQGYTKAASPITYTFSCFAKADEYNAVRLFCRTNSNGNSASATYNLLNGTFLVNPATTGTVTNASGTIQPYINGWYRCTLTFTTDSEIQVNTRVQNADTVQLIGDGVKGTLIWGAQLEQASNATSYIPTVATTVTRNADVISKTAISSLIGQTAGTIYAEIRVSKLLGIQSRYILHISDGTTNNRIYIAFSGASSNILRARIFDDGVLQCSIDSNTITNTGRFKLAIAYNNNDVIFYINGVQIGTDTSATIPDCSRIDIGQNFAGASQFNDSIINANVFKTRLTNTQLQQLTTL